MIEYNKILDGYAHNVYSRYSRLIPESEWGIKKLL